MKNYGRIYLIFWCIVVLSSATYFSWTYIMASFNWAMSWGPHLAAWRGVYGLLVTGVVAFFYIREQLHTRRSEVVQLQMDLRLARDSARHWEAKYNELLTELVVSRKGLNQKTKPS